MATAFVTLTFLLALSCTQSHVLAQRVLERGAKVPGRGVFFSLAGSQNYMDREAVPGIRHLGSMCGYTPAERESNGIDVKFALFAEQKLLDALQRERPVVLQFFDFLLPFETHAPSNLLSLHANSSSFINQSRSVKIASMVTAPFTESLFIDFDIQLCSCPGSLNSLFATVSSAVPFAISPKRQEHLANEWTHYHEQHNSAVVVLRTDHADVARLMELYAERFVIAANSKRDQPALQKAMAHMHYEEGMLHYDLHRDTMCRFFGATVPMRCGPDSPCLVTHRADHFDLTYKYIGIGLPRTGTGTLAKMMDDKQLSPRVKSSQKFLGLALAADLQPFKSALGRFKTAVGAPFHFPNVVRFLATELPNARFFLTERDPEEWARSVLRWVACQQPSSAFKLAAELNVTQLTRNALVHAYNSHHEELVHWFAHEDPHRPPDGWPNRLLTVDFGREDRKVVWRHVCQHLGWSGECPFSVPVPHLNAFHAAPNTMFACNHFLSSFQPLDAPDHDHDFLAYLATLRSTDKLFPMNSVISSRGDDDGGIGGIISPTTSLLHQQQQTTIAGVAAPTPVRQWFGGDLIILGKPGQLDANILADWLKKVLPYPERTRVRLTPSFSHEMAANASAAAAAAAKDRPVLVIGVMLPSSLRCMADKCLKNRHFSVMQFCGSEVGQFPECASPSKSSFNRALLNMQTHMFAVVLSDHRWKASLSHLSFLLGVNTRNSSELRFPPEPYPLPSGKHMKHWKKIAPHSQWDDRLVAVASLRQKHWSKTGKQIIQLRKPNPSPLHTPPRQLKNATLSSLDFAVRSKTTSVNNMVKPMLRPKSSIKLVVVAPPFSGAMWLGHLLSDLVLGSVRPVAVPSDGQFDEPVAVMDFLSDFTPTIVTKRVNTTASVASTVESIQRLYPGSVFVVPRRSSSIVAQSAHRYVRCVDPMAAEPLLHWIQMAAPVGSARGQQSTGMSFSRKSVQKAVDSFHVVLERLASSAVELVDMDFKKGPGNQDSEIRIRAQLLELVKSTGFPLACDNADCPEFISASTQMSAMAVGGPVFDLPLLEPQHEEWCDQALDDEFQLDFLAVRDGWCRPYFNESTSTTRHHRRQVLVYNRIPKTASTATMAWLKNNKRKGVKLTRPFGWLGFQQQHRQRLLNETLQEKFLKSLDSVGGTSLQRKILPEHFLFVDLETIKGSSFQLAADGPYYSSAKLNMDVAFINVMRDPVERCVSLYYFEIHRRRMPNRPFDECLLGGPCDFDADWTPSMNEVPVIMGNQAHQKPSYNFIRNACKNYAVHWFCGHDPVCALRDERALQLAIANIKLRHGWVGCTESLDVFLKLLSRRFPSVLQEVSTHQGNFVPVKLVTEEREPISTESRALLEKFNVMDRRLYAYISFENSMKARACLNKK